MCRSLTIDRGTAIESLNELASRLGRDRVRIELLYPLPLDWNSCLCPLDIEATAAAAGLVVVPYFDEARDPAEADLRTRRQPPARIFLDDEREPPPGDWWVCRSISDFAHAVACADATLAEVWLDYDLPLTEHRMNGLDAAHLLAGEAKRLRPELAIRLHSWNPAGVARMRDYLTTAMPAAALVEEALRQAAPLPPDNSECPDGPRYMALGNSMAVPVMAFIFARVQAEIDSWRRDGHCLLAIWRWASPVQDRTAEQEQMGLFGEERAMA